MVSHIIHHGRRLERWGSERERWAQITNTNNSNCGRGRYGNGFLFRHVINLVRIYIMWIHYGDFVQFLSLLLGDLVHTNPDVFF